MSADCCDYCGLFTSTAFHEKSKRRLCDVCEEFADDLFPDEEDDDMNAAEIKGTTYKRGEVRAFVETEKERG